MYFLYKFVVSLFYRGEKLWGFSFVHCGEVFNTVSLYQRVLFERFHCIVCTETILFEGSHQKMELNEFFSTIHHLQN